MTTGRINQVTTVFLREPGSPPTQPPRGGEGDASAGLLRGRSHPRLATEEESGPGRSKPQRNNVQPYKPSPKSNAEPNAGNAGKPATSAGCRGGPTTCGATETQPTKSFTPDATATMQPHSQKIPDVHATDASHPTVRRIKAGGLGSSVALRRRAVQGGLTGSPTAPRLNKRHRRVSTGAVEHTAAAVTAAPHSSLPTTS